MVKVTAATVLVASTLAGGAHAKWFGGNQAELGGCFWAGAEGMAMSEELTVSIVVNPCLPSACLPPRHPLTPSDRLISVSRLL